VSRSIHETRASLARREAEDVSREEVRREAVDRARRALDRKRGMKYGAVAGRRPRERGHTAPETISVTITPAGPHALFPASVDDVREILRRLPRGATDGLARVEMRLGRETQAECAAEEPASEEPDPFTGRLSWTRFPGVWTGRVLGRYRADAAAIELYAYVVEPAHPLRAVWEPLLRLEAMATLVHEVAHHHDHTERVARGRWVAGEREPLERYAERMQHEWTHAVVLPYLRQRYAGDVAAVERWVAKHGGIALRFEELADDPRLTRRGGLVHAERIWPMSGGVATLARAVDRGEPLWACRRTFAGELYLQSRYDDALAVLRRVLRAQPGDPQALRVKAGVFLRQHRWRQALALGRELARRDPAMERAWEVVADACEGLGWWGEAEAAFARLLELADERRIAHVLLDRAWLRIRSGNLAGARADLDRIDCAGSAYLLRRVARLRAQIEPAMRTE
jgi:tetratricopeptide (TPR) repeat protein